jgi:hypothetical protein
MKKTEFVECIYCKEYNSDCLECFKQLEMKKINIGEKDE